MNRAWPLVCLLSALGCGAEDVPAEPSTAALLDEAGRLTTLRCPGDVGCRDAQGTLRVGAAARVITPTFEPWTDDNGNRQWDEGEAYDDVDGDGEHDAVWMAGFGRGRAATSVHDDNWSRVMIFERGDLRVGLVVLDLIGYFHDDVISVREAAEAAGLELDHVLVASTHQHEGKDSMGVWGETPLVTGRDPDYMAMIVSQTVSALEEAQAGLRAAKLRYAVADAPELIHDSREPEVIDPRITTLQALDATDERPFATLVVWGNHPEALDDETTITSDYPHYLRARLEATYPDSTAVFFPGTLGGLMNPLHIIGCPNEAGERTCEAGTFELAEYVGEGVAARVIESLDGVEAHEDTTLAVLREPFYVSIRNFAFLTAYVSGLFDRRLFDRAEQPVNRAQAEDYGIEEILDGAVRFQSEVNAITLGPIELVTVPGELYPELWLTDEAGGSLVIHNDDVDFPDAPVEPALRTLMPSGRSRAIVNQGNDALGYIIPKVQYDFDPPFAYGRRQYGEVNSVGPDIAPEIAAAVRAMYDR